MSEYSLQQFIVDTKENEQKNEFFVLETERVLEVNLQGQVWAKVGTMISYIGDIKFEREKISEQGFGKMFKKALTGEGTALMKATGNGKLYLADKGKKITIFNLDEEMLTVNGNNLLAFEPTVQWDIRLMRKISGMMSGGLFNVLLEGKGKVAITTHFEPLTLKVTKERPIFTDPNSTVAWSGNLTPEFKTDVNIRTFIGRGSGESVQMKFVGEGFVIVQPFEEIYMATTTTT
ncbi:MAG: AIM24 family protein [Kurthia sp.]|nr:AIM24 family protein [Candidatus Kurthia equi]